MLVSLISRRVRSLLVVTAAFVACAGYVGCSEAELVPPEPLPPCDATATCPIPGDAASDVDSAPGSEAGEGGGPDAADAGGDTAVPDAGDAATDGDAHD